LSIHRPKIPPSTVNRVRRFSTRWSGKVNQTPLVDASSLVAFVDAMTAQ
jgi:hypothetical protein